MLREELHDSDTKEHHARRYEDEGRGPDSQADADRQYTTDEPPPSIIHSETINPAGRQALSGRTSMDIHEHSPTPGSCC
jgi:hypothetical protein